MHSIQDDTAKFEKAIDNLRDGGAPFAAETIYSLSDLAGQRLEVFRSIWADLPLERRRSLIARLVETAETNFELDFSAIVFPALDDSDDRIRKTAIDGIFEDSPFHVIERLMQMSQDDPLSEIRASAAAALGQFVLKGELGKLPPRLNTRLQDTMLALHHNLNEDLDVRRRALEAVSNCGREGVHEMIRAAYYAEDLPMRVSAVFAMGRSCDEVWAPQILEELSSDYASMRYEAARAAGELELRPALARLAEMAYEDDREIQEMAVWALGEIGGKAARNVLSQLAALADETGDAELADAVSEAQSAATLSGEDMFPLFDFSDFEGDTDTLDLYGDDDDYEDDDYEDDDLDDFDEDLYDDELFDADSFDDMDSDEY
jgi:HEAT repeat protein